MRVGYVVKRYPRYSETFVVNEILAHEAAGLQVEIFALRPPNDTHFQDLLASVRAPVTYLPSEGLKAIDLWDALRRAATLFPDTWRGLAEADGTEAVDIAQAALLACEVYRRGITHLHAHFASVATTVARLAARWSGLPYTFTAHAKDIFHADVRPDDLARKLADAAAVITVSDYNAAFLRREFGATAQSLERIYNGVDLQRLHYETPQTRPQRIVAIGRLVEKKGFADLVEACAILDRRGRTFNCLIIGAGPLEIDLDIRIQHVGLEGKVALLGPRPHAEVARYLREAAVAAAPCLVGSDGNQDGLPTMLVEAMAVGTPCVSTDVSGIPEVVRHNVTGLVVPQHDPAALADAIERLLLDSALRVRLGAAARDLVEREFDVRRTAARLREVFSAVAVQDMVAVGSPP